MIRRLQETLIGFAPARRAVGLLMLYRGKLRLRSGQLYRAMLDLCWVARVADIPSLTRQARPAVFETIAALRREPVNALVASYLRDPAAEACAGMYSLGGGPRDLFRDLIVLKRATAAERGVIVLKYARTFDAVVSLFDVPRLMDRYIFVLEPCWAGYCHPSTMMYLARDTPVFVQCFTDEDHQFVSDIGAPMVPLRLGPADWVHADLFRPPAGANKPFDLVMVANWSRQKRHAQLFRALKEIESRRIRVLLIGFPWAGRTATDIRREADRIGNPLIEVEIVEQIPQDELAAQVARCKAFVFLNKKEGDNKALVEAMFAGVPAIVYDQTIGGARSRINPATGLLTSDKALAESIRYMLDHHEQFTPRRWALEHTGSAMATRQLNEAIKRTVLERGGRYTEDIVEKTNSPNLAYKTPADRARFQPDYDFIMGCQRGGHVGTSAVA